MKFNISSSDKRTLLELVKQELQISGAEYEIGFFPESTYPSRHNILNDEGGTPVAQVAYWNEYGRYIPDEQKIVLKKGKKIETIIIPPHEIPPRPFFSTAVDNSMKKAVEKAVENISNGKGDERGILLGANYIKDAVKESIQTWRTPPNSPITRYIKGSSNPLVDTGRMMKSVQVKKI